MAIIPKLCLQGWTQPLQSLLYWRLPFSSRKNVHSRCRFLLRLMSLPITGTSSAERACLAFFVPPTLVLHPSTAPEWKFFLRGSPARFDLAFSTSLTRRSLLAIPSIKDWFLSNKEKSDYIFCQSLFWKLSCSNSRYLRSAIYLVSDLAMPTGDVDQVLHVLVILGLTSEKGSLVQHGLSRRCGLRRIFP